MKVICIKLGSGYHFHDNKISDENSLTVGKVYDSVRVFFDPGITTYEDLMKELFLVCQKDYLQNDYGLLTWYRRSILMPLDEWREKQLNQIWN